MILKIRGCGRKADPYLEGSMNPARTNRRENGSAMLVAFFVLALVSGIGIALLFVSTHEVHSSNADVRSKQVFYLAEAGMEAARATLRNTNGAGPFTDDLTTHAGADGVIDFDPDALEVTYDTDGNVTGLTGYDDDLPLIAPTAFGDGWYAAFISNDAVNGTSPTDTNDRIVITGIGMGPQNSFEIVQSVVTRELVIPPAAITLLGPSPTFVGGHSNPKQYVGEDCGGTGGTPGLYAPLVGVIGSSAEAGVESGIGSNPAYSSGPYLGDQTFADLLDSGEPTYHTALDAVWTDCEALVDMIEKIRLIADVVCTSGTSCTLPPSSPDRVIFVDDDYALNEDGAGLIVVTGDFTTNGGVAWEGMMWAIGTGQFRRNGGGAAEISGSILAADVAGPDGIYGNADDCTMGVGGFGPASFDENGGGNGATTYCTDDILASSPAYPYEIVEFRQH